VWSWASPGALPAGPHAVSWNGERAGGGTAAAGLYFVRATAGPAAGVTRLVRAR